MPELRGAVGVVGVALLCACPEGEAIGTGLSAGSTAITTGVTAVEASTGPTLTDGGSATSDAATTTGMEEGTSSTGDTEGVVPMAPVSVHLVPQPGVTGTQRVNLAVPLAPGLLFGDDVPVRVRAGGVELPAVARGLAMYATDGSWRSVQVQFDVEVAGESDVEVALGEAPGVPAIAAVPVEQTLQGSDGPRVWALLPKTWMADSGVAGPMVADGEIDGALAAWASKCDAAKFGVDAFMAEKDNPDAWLHDRGTALYRGHVRRGDLASLRSAYLETSLYMAGLTGSGATTQVGVMGKGSDAKFYYAQSLALHYLLTGDDRFRERAEDVAEAMSVLWVSPGYAGGKDFWTERHAGFALLAYVWALIVTDDQHGEFEGLARAAVAAYVDVQETYPKGYADPDARCFAHSADAAIEDYGYFGCSPWFSAVLAEALEQYATELGGNEADRARTSIVKLGRSLARDGRDMTGKPFFWMGVDNGKGEVDGFEQHWGESAYVVAMAWHLDGRGDAALREAADALVAGFAGKANVPHLRSFTWQCRSAAATPWFLRP